MAYSNRPSRRSDPTIAPSYKDPVTGRVGARRPFQPSSYLETKNKSRETLREVDRARRGGR